MLSGEGSQALRQALRPHAHFLSVTMTAGQLWSSFLPSHLTNEVTDKSSRDHTGPLPTVMTALLSLDIRAMHLAVY